MDMANDAWNQFMQECAVEVVDTYDATPPQNFEVLFDQ